MTDRAHPASCSCVACDPASFAERKARAAGRVELYPRFLADEMTPDVAMLTADEARINAAVAALGWRHSGLTASYCVELMDRDGRRAVLPRAMMAALVAKMEGNNA